MRHNEECARDPVSYPGYVVYSTIAPEFRGNLAHA